MRKRGREEDHNGRFAEWIFSAGSHLCLHQYYPCYDDLHDALHGHPFLGNAGLMSFGAYTSAILTAQYHVPMPVGIFLGGVMAVLVALVIGLPTIRLRGLYLAIATLGFGEVVRVIALNLEITHGALGYSGITSMGSVLSDYASNWGSWMLWK